MLLAGAEFYGPDGIYPFAGHECARAFALISTDVADCNDNLEVKITSGLANSTPILWCTGFVSFIHSLAPRRQDEMYGR